MTVGIASRNYDFTKRFYECAQKRKTESLRFCGPAWDRDQLRQMILYHHPDVIVFEEKDPWNGPNFRSCELCYRNTRTPVPVHFTYTPDEVLTPVGGTLPPEKGASGEGGDPIPDFIRKWCRAVSEASRRIVEKSAEQKRIAFRCAVIAVMERRGLVSAMKGYHYILEIMDILYKNPDSAGRKEELYNRIAKANHTTVLRVDKAVRYAVASAGGRAPDDRFLGEILREARSLVDGTENLV